MALDLSTDRVGVALAMEFEEMLIEWRESMAYGLGTANF